MLDEFALDPSVTCERLAEVLPSVLGG